MSQIHLRFGAPCNEWATEMVEKIAINHDVTIEHATYIMFDTLIKSLGTKTDGQCSFDTVFGLALDTLVYAPKVLARKYVEGRAKNSMIVLTKDYVLQRVTGSQIALAEKDLAYFGQDFEANFGLEYLGYRRAGQRK